MKHLHHPPVYFLLTTAAGITSRWWTQEWLRFPGRAKWPALVLFAMGSLLGTVSVVLFLCNRTGIIPFSPAKKVVTGGFYKITRNPMYLGLLLIQLSLFLVFGNAISLAFTPLYWWILHFHFVLNEEKFLRKHLGKNYEQFLQKTRRWL